MRSDTGPFALVPEWVLDSPLSDRAVRLYAVLARYADSTSGEAWPSRQTLWKRLNCSERSLDAAKNELEVVGAIGVERRWKESGDPTTNRWIIHRAPPLGVGQETTPPGAASDARGGAETAAQNENHLELELLSLAPAERPPKERKKDPLFDAVCAACGVNTAELNQQSRGPLNAAVKALRESGAEPNEIARRAQALRLKFPTAAVTAPSLAKHWPELGNGQTHAATNVTSTVEEDRAFFTELAKTEGWT